MGSITVCMVIKYEPVNDIVSNLLENIFSRWNSEWPTTALATVYKGREESQSYNASLIPAWFYDYAILSKNLKIKIYKITILPVVLYECRLRVFESRILRRIFGPRRDENGKWRRLHNEKFYSLFCSANIVRVIKSRRMR